MIRKRMYREETTSVDCCLKIASPLPMSAACLVEDLFLALLLLVAVRGCAHDKTVPVI